MIKISGNDILKDGAKVGWIQDNRIYNIDGEKVGYVTGNDVMGATGVKKGYFTTEGYRRVGKDTVTRLEDLSKKVTGGDYGDLERAAIFTFFS